MLKTLITGVGRCGSTFMALTLHRAGYYFGETSEVNPKAVGTFTNPGQGMELRELSVFNSYLQTRIGIHSDQETARRNHERLTELFHRLPDTAKNATFCRVWPVWMECGCWPETIILCRRDHDAIAASYRECKMGGRDPKGLLKVMEDGAFALEKQRNVIVVDFPEVAESPNAWNEKLADVCEYRHASVVFDAAMVHHAGS